MYRAPAAVGAPLGRVQGGSQFAYMVERHVWLTGGVRTVPTGQPLGPNASNAERTAFSQAGLGLGYTLSEAVRAITNWNAGLGPTSVSPGNQFTVGVTWRH